MRDQEELKYHIDHAWADVSGDRATMGITDFAQDQLGEVVYIDLPEPGARIVKGTEICEIESTKAISSFVAPLSGTILQVNEELRDTVDVVNASPYGGGWIVMVELTDLSERADLLSAADYQALVKGR